MWEGEKHGFGGYAWIQPDLRAWREEHCRTGSGVEPVLPCCVVTGGHFILGLNCSIWHLMDYFLKTPLFYLKQKKSPIFFFFFQISGLSDISADNSVLL